MVLEFLCTQSPSRSSPCLSSCLCTRPQQVLPLQLWLCSCALGSYFQVNCPWEPGRVGPKASGLGGTSARLELRRRCGAHQPPLSRPFTESTNQGLFVHPREPRQRLHPAAAPVQPCLQSSAHPHQVRSQLFALCGGKYVVCERCSSSWKLVKWRRRDPCIEAISWKWKRSHAVTC